MVRFHRWLTAAVFTLAVVTGCATPDRIEAVPDELYLDAAVPGDDVWTTGRGVSQFRLVDGSMLWPIAGEKTLTARP